MAVRVCSWVVALKLWLVVVNMGGGSVIIAGPGWSWEVAAKLWLIVGGRGGGGKIMAGRG